MDIAKALRVTASARSSSLGNTVEGTMYGAQLASGAVRGVRNVFSPRDSATVASNMRSAARSADELDGSLERSAGSANKLSGALGRVTDSIKQNYKAYMSWAAIGGLVASGLADLSADADRVVESYYGMGESMNRARGGMKGLIKDTWNLSRISGDLEMVAARMNLPAEAAKGLTDKLLRSVRTFYGVNGNIRKDMLNDAARQILAFSRITGASVDQATDLYAKMTNQYGRSHRSAVGALQTVARSAQLVNEELHDMGKDGGVFVEDLIGIINDASGAFDGFSLNIEHLSARTAHAVKIGQQLGMTYNQAADTAKQMTSIFAKPGGYVGFQAGEQLRQDIEKTVAGISDIEARAQAIRTKFGVNIATARGLDIAAKGPNAQMNVMDMMKGTQAGMEKQFTLMQDQARNNSMSLDVFKQFVGGENLSSDQASDLMQLLRDQNSTFGDFNRHLQRSKKEASADKVIEGSVLVPTMVKEWIKGTSGAMKINIAAGLGALKFGLLVLAAVKIVGIVMFVYKAIKNIGQVIHNVDQLLEKNFGEAYKARRDAIKDKLAVAREKAAAGWKYVRSGKLFTDIGSFFTSTKNALGNLVDMFRRGQASVTIKGYARDFGNRARDIGGRAADRARDIGGRARAYGERAWENSADLRNAGMGNYDRLKARGAVMAGTSAEYARKKADVGRELARKHMEETQAQFDRVKSRYTGSASDPAFVKLRAKAAEDAKLAFEKANTRSRTIMSGVAQYADSKSRDVANYAKTQYGKRSQYAKEALRASTETARVARDSAISMSRRARTRLRSGAPGAIAGSGGSAAAAGDAASIMSDAGMMAGGAGGGMLGMMASVMSMGSMFGGGGADEGVVPRATAKERLARLKARAKEGAAKTRGKLWNTAKGMPGAVAPVTDNLSKASRWGSWWNRTWKGDLAVGAEKALRTEGSVRRRVGMGALKAAASMGGRHLGRAAVITGGAATAYGMYQSGMPNEETSEEDVQRAGGRKYDKDIEEKTAALDGLSEQLDIAKMAGNEQEAEVLQKEYENQKALLDTVNEDRDRLDAKDRHVEEVEGRIDKLKKAKKNAKSKISKDLLAQKIELLEQEQKKDELELNKAGLSSTSTWTKMKSIGSMLMTVDGIIALGRLALGAAAGTKVWSVANKAAGWAWGVLESIGSSAIGKLGGVGKFIKGAQKTIAGGMVKMRGSLIGRIMPTGLLSKIGTGNAIGGLITGLMTEGSWDKKAFVGTGTALLAAGGTAGGTALGGLLSGGATVATAGAAAPTVPFATTALGVAGGAAGTMLGQAFLGDVYDMLHDAVFGKGPDGKAPVAVRPDVPSGSMAGSNSSVAAGQATGTMGTPQADGSVTIKVNGFVLASERAGAMIDKRDTGLSGG